MDDVRTMTDETQMNGTTWVRKPESYKLSQVTEETEYDTFSDGTVVAGVGAWVLEGTTTGEFEVLDSIESLREDFEEVDEWDTVSKDISSQVSTLGSAVSDLSEKIDANQKNVDQVLMQLRDEIDRLQRDLDDRGGTRGASGPISPIS